MVSANPNVEQVMPKLKYSMEECKQIEGNVKEKLQSSPYADKVKAQKSYCVFARIRDIIVSSIALIFLSLPMLVIALIIYAEDGHSPFFHQLRMTANGKTFVMTKFRSMRPDADSPEMLAKVRKLNESDGPAFKVENDPRLTKIGRKLRETSLDELPQLINVFLGDMSLVGPRPPLPREVAVYTPYQMNRLLVKGGLTCIWQTQEKRNETSFDNWMKMDVEYIEKRSFAFDIKLILKTFKVIVTKQGR